MNNLLFPGQGARAVLSKDLLYHLSADRALEVLCPDLHRREALWKELSAPAADPAEITLRQEILQDFLKDPLLLSDLSDLLERFCALRASHEQQRREEARAAGKGNEANAKQLLESTALTLKRCLLFLQAMGEILEKASPVSRGLTALRERMRALTTPTAFAELVQLCATLESFPARGFVDQSFCLNDEGQICGAFLVSHRDLQITDPTLITKKGWFRRREEPTAGPTGCLDVTAFFRPNSTREALLATPLWDLAKQLSGYAQALFEEFCPYQSTLTFYEGALDYCRCLTEKGVSFCFPSVNETATEFCELRDLFLLSRARNGGEVIPYRLSAAKDTQIAVFGANGSGKTVFLRAVGTAQLLFQAGLPIPAREATMTVRSGLFSQFSEAEKELADAEKTGRFEQEAREIAEMLEALAPGALVLLNETFQTTAYGEGAQGLLPILRYFASHGIGYLLVSHLRDLEEPLAREGVAILHTAKGYQLQRIP
ncbi:MAG: hypothetical protein IJX28_07085 [Clostridia bacterium]|nr:hypothetical protein [Clostridia bacterium]